MVQHDDKMMLLCVHIQHAPYTKAHMRSVTRYKDVFSCGLVIPRAKNASCNSDVRGPSETEPDLPPTSPPFDCVDNHFHIKGLT